MKKPPKKSPDNEALRARINIARRGGKRAKTRTLNANPVSENPVSAP